jgi:hypothetical protein
MYSLLFVGTCQFRCRGNRLPNRCLAMGAWPDSTLRLSGVMSQYNVMRYKHNSVKFNSTYLRANLTAQRPITKRARVEKKKIHTYKQNTKAKQ